MIGWKTCVLVLSSNAIIEHISLETAAYSTYIALHMPQQDVKLRMTVSFRLTCSLVHPSNGVLRSVPIKILLTCALILDFWPFSFIFVLEHTLREHGYIFMFSALIKHPSERLPSSYPGYWPHLS